jgi:hypothetical protein
MTARPGTLSLLPIREWRVELHQGRLLWSIHRDGPYRVWRRLGPAAKPRTISPPTGIGGPKVQGKTL